MAVQTSSPTLVQHARAARTTIALKLMMATSGIIFILFVLAHMYGNLKAFQGQTAFNTYAEHLRTMGQPILPYAGALWIIRAVMIIAIVVHVACALILLSRAKKARPIGYQAPRKYKTAFSSRTMRWGGATIFVFVIWHLLEFTIVKINVGSGGQTDSVTQNPYELLVHSFDVWWMTIIYLIAMLALGLHLHHGTFSSLQTLGWTNSAVARHRARVAGWVLAIVIAGGFSLIPLFTLFGVISK